MSHLFFVNVAAADDGAIHLNRYQVSKKIGGENGFVAIWKANDLQDNDKEVIIKEKIDKSFSSTVLKSWLYELHAYATISSTPPLTPRIPRFFAYESEQVISPLPCTLFFITSAFVTKLEEIHCFFFLFLIASMLAPPDSFPWVPLLSTNPLRPQTNSPSLLFISGCPFFWLAKTKKTNSIMTILILWNFLGIKSTFCYGVHSRSTI